MSLGGGEMEVHESLLSWGDVSACQNVLGRTSLMGGQHVVHSEHFLYRCLQSGETFRSGVGIIGYVHGSCLAVRHGIHSRVGQHVHVYVTVLQQEGVVACFLYLAQSLFRRE